MAISNEDRALLDDPEFQKFVSNQLNGGASLQAPKNEPGFKSSFKSGLASNATGVGQLAADFVPGVGQDNWLKEYGRGVEAANPSSAASQSWEGFKESPWQGTKEFVGGALGSTLPSIAAALLSSGTSIPATGAAASRGLLARGATWVAANPVQTAVAAVPFYGQTREAQHQYGYTDDTIGDKLGALGASALAGKIESGLGVQRYLGKAGSSARADLVKEFASSPLKTGVKTFGKTGLQESGEEGLQQPLQQMAAYQDPTTEASLRDTGWGMFGGLIGGLGLGGISGGRMGMAHSKINAFRQSDLLNPNTPLETLDDQAKWNQAFIERDDGASAGQQFYEQRQQEIDNYIESLVPGFLESASEDEANAARRAVLEEKGNQFGIGEKSGVKQKDVAAAFGEKTEPTIILNEEGEPFQTTSAYDVYAFNHDKENRFTLHNARLEEAKADRAQVEQSAATLPEADVAAVMQKIDQRIESLSSFAPTNLLNPETQDAKSIPPVVETGSQGSGGDAGAGAGNLGNQPVVGRGGNSPAGAPVASGGTNQPVGTEATKRPRGVKAQAFEAKLNEAIAKGEIPADDPLVTDWHASRKLAGDAKDFSTTLGDRQAGVIVPQQTPEAALQAEAEAKKTAQQAVTTTTGAVTASTPMNLTQKQVPVFQHLQKAFAENRADDVIDAQGVFKYTEIAEALGMERGSAKSFINGVAKKIAESQGVTVDEMKAALRASAPINVEASDYDKLGLSPAKQSNHGITETDILGSGEGGAEQSMGIINSVGGSQSDVAGKDVAPPESSNVQTAEEVAREEQRAQEAKAEADTVFDEILRHPEAKNAALDWNDAKKNSSPAFVELTRGEQAELIYDYAEAAEEGDWAAIERAIQRFENSLEATRDAGTQNVVEETAQLAGPSVSGQTESGIPGVSVPTQGTEQKPKVEVRKRRTIERPEGEVKRSVRSDAVDRLAAAVEKWKGVVADLVAGKLSPNVAHVLFPSTPASMQALHMPDLPVKVLNHALRYLNDRLTQKQLEQIPAEIADPVAVTMHEEQDGTLSFTFITRLTTANGFLTVGIKPNGNLPQGGPANYVVTIVPLTQGKLLTELREGRAAYVGDLGQIPGAKDAFQQGKRESGRQAVNFRNSISRRFNLSTALDKVVYKSDLVKLIDEGKAQFSNSESAGVTNPTTVAGINKLLKGLFFSGKRFDDKVVIVQSVVGLDPALRSKHDEKTQAFVKNGKVYMIADNIESGKELAVFLHEVGAHLGMQKLLGPENYAKLVEQIKQWAENSDGREGDLARAALRRVLNAEENLGEEYGQPDFDDELLAYFVEESVLAGVNPTAVGKAAGPMANWFRTFWAAAKLALRKFGLDRIEQLSAQNIVDIAYGAARLELEGTWHGTAADFRNFRHTYMGSGEGAQAFGWGTYLAQRVGIAKEYWKADIRRKETRTTKKLEWKDETPEDATKAVGDLKILSTTDNFGQLRTISRAFGEWYLTAPDVDGILGKFASEKEAKDYVEYNGMAQPEGSIMRVDVNIHDDEFLDWDKPLSAQSEVVQDAAKENGVLATAWDAVNWGRDNASRGDSGERLYSWVSTNLGSDKAASAYLDSIGIKGIKFLDAQSRGVKNRAYYQAEIEKLQNKLSDIKAQIAFAESLGKSAASLFIEKNQVEDLLWRTKQQLATTPESETRNLVIFNDKNIVRVASQVGARRDSGSIKYSIAAPQQEFINSVKDAASGFASNQIGHLKEIGLGSLTLDQMATLVKSAAIQQYTKVMTDIQRFSKERIYRAALIEQPWAKLDKTVQKNLSQVMRDATRAQYDPAKKGEVADTDEKAAVKKKFDALPPQAKDVYVSVRDYYDAMFDERKQILMGAAGKAKAAGKNTREVDALFAKLKGPYFPLMRIGRWYSVGMSDRVADLMKKRDEGSLTKPETDELAKLRKDKNHYVSRGHMTRAEAQRSEKELKAQLGNARSNRAEQKIGSEISKMPDLANVESYIAADLPSDVRAKVKDMVAQMYFDMLPEHNALKRQMKREGIHGEEEDMRRVFAASAMSLSHQIGRLKYANDLSGAMVGVKADGRKDETRRMVANELMTRTGIAMDFEETPLTDRLLQVSYFAHLGVSPAFWFINMTQVPVITLPWLTARHGLRVSGRALAGAYADTFELIKSTYKGGDWRSEFDWSSKFKEGSPEDRLFRELLDRNLLDITMEHDLGSVVNMANGKLDNTIKMLNLPVRVTEFANRSITALAAYRLAMSKPGTSHDAAVNHAIQALNDTQLNYSTLNSPRYMQELAGSKPLARIVFQFRKFQQGMLWLVAKNAYDAVKDESPEVRKEARNMLLGLSATTGLFAGALGLPAAGTLAFIANTIAQAFGDDDEPWDAETELRNWLTDMFGKDAAKVLTKGLPTLAGVDLSKRVGLGDVASPLPFARQGKTGTEKLSNTLVAAAGAPFGTMATLLDGAMELADGNFAKGAEKIVPIKLAQNLIRAGRYGTEGLTDKNGNVIVSDDRFSPWDLAMRGAGFQTTTEADYYEGNQAVQKAKHAAMDTRSKLLRKYAQAKLHGEPTQAFEESIREFNQRHPEKGIRIDGSAKLRSVQAHRKMARERDDSGIRQDKLSKPFLDEARFVM